MRLAREWSSSGVARALWIIVLALGAAATLAGCQYLYGSALDEDVDTPKQLATYVDGSASVTIGDADPIELGELNNGALYEDFWGGEATWSNGDGWYVRISGASGNTGMFAGLTALSLDRVAEGRHWTTFDSSRCVVTIEQADERGLKGTASCKGLRWSDALGAFGGLGVGLEPTYIDGEDPFDAEIRFDALPPSTAPA